jgi:tetratricopeptide (TPR) repeat protein
MQRRLLLWIGALLLSPGLAVAQDSSWREDLSFVESLRARNDSDLALEFLEQMAKGATPELLKELPLEFAKTRLRIASEEPDTSKRLTLYNRAREDFEKFIAANPGHPRIAEANLDIARVLNLQGKTELNRAYLIPEKDAKLAEATRARGTLEKAAGRLEAALVELEALRAKIPDPETVTDKAARLKVQGDIRRSEYEIAQTKLDRALNLYDRAQTYNFGGDQSAASALLQEATKILGPLKGGKADNPITYTAGAWLGRCLYDIETADKARETYQGVLTEKVAAAAEGQRLARYFKMLLQKAKPTKDEEPKLEALLRTEGENWRKAYPNFRKTPEGYGVAFLLANIYVAQSANMKLTKIQQDGVLNLAIPLLAEIESSENEFTERARTLKISIKERQGLFTKKVTDLTTFEDCYVRAQYELIHYQKDPEAKRKERIETVMAVLRRGLTMARPKTPQGTLEWNTARSTLAYWALNSDKFEEAIAAGEGFAREDPKLSQAASSAVYALQAYNRADRQEDGGVQDRRGGPAPLRHAAPGAVHGGSLASGGGGQHGPAHGRLAVDARGEFPRGDQEALDHHRRLSVVQLRAVPTGRPGHEGRQGQRRADSRRPQGRLSQARPVGAGAHARTGRRQRAGSVSHLPAGQVRARPRVVQEQAVCRHGGPVRRAAQATARVEAQRQPEKG